MGKETCSNLADFLVLEKVTELKLRSATPVQRFTRGYIRGQSVLTPFPKFNQRLGTDKVRCNESKYVFSSNGIDGKLGWSIRRTSLRFRFVEIGSSLAFLTCFSVYNATGSGIELS